jgi:hypothetical protein
MIFGILILLGFLLLLSLPASANPLVCMVCSVAVAGGLGISRYLGVNDAATGVWAGAFLFAMGQWTNYFFEKKGKKSLWLKIVSGLFWYAMLIPLYYGVHPSLVLNAQKLLWVDSFLLAVVAGSLVLWGSIKLYQFLKAKNGGKPHFQFEKVVLPIVLLLLVSVIFNFVA